MMTESLEYYNVRLSFYFSCETDIQIEAVGKEFAESKAETGEKHT